MLVTALTNGVALKISTRTCVSTIEQSFGFSEILRIKYRAKVVWIYRGFNKKKGITRWAHVVPAIPPPIIINSKKFSSFLSDILIYTSTSILLCCIAFHIIFYYLKGAANYNSCSFSPFIIEISYD